MATKRKMAKSKEEAFQNAWNDANEFLNKKIEKELKAQERKRKAANAKRKKSSK